jgi:diguanylate cyclase (GGDEF)-like protein
MRRHKPVADQAESEGIPQVARHAGARPPIDLSARTGRHLAALKPEGPFEPFTNATVMLVDDEPICLEVVQVFLQEAGYHTFVSTAKPTEVMSLMEQVRPDVLLLDLVMPDISGFQILAAIRGNPDLRYTPVIVLTAESDSERKLESLELGATDFLTKPVDPSELRLRIRNALAFKAYQDRLAKFDNLTGLPNRNSFLRGVEPALSRVVQQGQRCALMHLDLDDFKQINDTLGHNAGDRVLCVAAGRLEHAVPPPQPRQVPADDTPTVARLSGDEFVVLTRGIADATEAGAVAEKILSAFHDPFLVGGHELFVTPCIGIALCPDDAEDVDTLLKHAEMAMYEAKQLGRNTYEFFSRQKSAEAMDRLMLANALRRALDRKEFLVHYQPKVDVMSGRICGFEALLRWQHADLGMVPPGNFIPLAEKLGLIVDIGQWVIEEACCQVQAWRLNGLPVPQVSVNVSPAQFKERKIMGAVEQALSRSGLESGCLTLELTESMLMENAKASIAMLREVKAMGLRISVDDFGTGYSCLSYLTQFPLDELKIDRSFLGDPSSNSESAAVVSAVIALGKALKLKVVAEGVETQQQLEFLRTRLCDEYQGFLYSKPLPPLECAQLLRCSPAQAACAFGRVGDPDSHHHRNPGVSDTFTLGVDRDAARRRC